MASTATGPAPRAGAARPSPRRALQAAVAVLVLLVAAGLAGAGYLGDGPLPGRLGHERQTLTPVAVAELGEGGDPLVVNVLVPWPKDGWCSGQFTVTATESATEVRVGQVRSDVLRGGGCAGLGTADGRAYAGLQLRQPLGRRLVVRASDGAELPVTRPQG